jgi:hypothetical protein
MKLNTLNTIIDDVMLTLRNSNISESESISRIQVEQWVHNYRALLIKQDIDKGRDINPMYVQTLKCVHLDSVTTCAGYTEYVSDIELPRMIDFHYKPGIVAITDLYDNLIQIGSASKSKYQRFRKNTCGDYIAYVKDNRACVSGDNNALEYINISLIAENPAEATQCYSPDDTYPIPANMIPTVKDMIFTKELNIMVRVTSDVTNDSKDDNQHSVTQ